MRPPVNFNFSGDIKSFVTQSAVYKLGGNRCDFGSDSYYRIVINSQGKEIESLSSLNNQQTMTVEPLANTTPKQRATFAQNASDLILSLAALSTNGIDVTFQGPVIEDGVMKTTELAHITIPSSDPASQRKNVGELTNNFVTAAHKFESRINSATRWKHA